MDETKCPFKVGDRVRMKEGEYPSATRKFRKGVVVDAEYLINNSYYIHIKRDRSNLTIT